MKRSYLTLGLAAAVLLIALAVLFTVARYRGPAGAATGGAEGCGGDPVATAPDDLPGEDEELVGQEEAGDEAPAQVVYEQFEGDKSCLRVTIEPLDRIATIDRLCGQGPTPVIIDLATAEAQEVLAACQELVASPCTVGECPLGQRATILTRSEETIVIPYRSPLRESVERILADGQAPAAAVAAAPVKTLVLGPESGALFGSGGVVKEASPLGSDLICYKSSKTVDLQAGAGPTMAKQKSLKLFRTPGKTVQTFGTIDELPDELPEPADRDMVHNAEAGWGFVVQNNVSAGHTQVFVQQADGGKVVLQYRVVE